MGVLWTALIFIKYQLYHPQNNGNIFLFHSYSFIAVFFFSNCIGLYSFKEMYGKSKYSGIVSDVHDGS